MPSCVAGTLPSFLGGAQAVHFGNDSGAEHRYIEYLSPKWMEMLAFTVAEARRLGLDVDMTLGTGWCFGGPHVTELEANAVVIVRTNIVRAGETRKVLPARRSASLSLSRRMPGW